MPPSGAERGNPVRNPTAAGHFVSTFGRFLFAGAAATLVQYTLLIALVGSNLLAPVPASALGYLAGALVNYLLNYHLTFRSRRRHREASVRFALVVAGGLGLNSLSMALWVEGFGLHYLLAQILTTGLVLIWNYNAHARWSFRVCGNGLAKPGRR